MTEQHPQELRYNTSPDITTWLCVPLLKPCVPFVIGTYSVEYYLLQCPHWWQSIYLLDGGPRSAGWRDHTGPGESRRRKFDFDFRDSEGHGGGRRRAGSDGLEDERDGLPEWCTDEEDGEMGTFDSSGAFMPMKVCFLIFNLCCCLSLLWWWKLDHIATFSYFFYC